MSRKRREDRKGRRGNLRSRGGGHVSVSGGSIFGGVRTPPSVQSLPMAAIGGKHVLWPRLEESDAALVSTWFEHVTQDLLECDFVKPREFTDPLPHEVHEQMHWVSVSVPLTHPGDTEQVDSQNLAMNLSIARAGLLSSIKDLLASNNASVGIMYDFRDGANGRRMTPEGPYRWLGVWVILHPDDQQRYCASVCCNIRLVECSPRSQ